MGWYFFSEINNFNIIEYHIKLSQLNKYNYFLAYNLQVKILLCKFIIGIII